MLIEILARESGTANREYSKVYVETDCINIIDTYDYHIWVNNIKYKLDWATSDAIVKRILAIKKAEQRDIKIDEILD